MKNDLPDAPGMMGKVFQLLKKYSGEEATSLKVTRLRIIGAFVVAIVADLIQLPLTAATATGVGAVPAEGIDAAVDVAAALITNYLLGFHWALLPTFMIELVPGVDVLPTWTACVAYVVWRRHNQQLEKPVPKVIDVAAEKSEKDATR